MNDQRLDILDEIWRERVHQRDEKPTDSPSLWGRLPRDELIRVAARIVGEIERRDE